MIEEDRNSNTSGRRKNTFSWSSSSSCSTQLTHESQELILDEQETMYSYTVLLSEFSQVDMKETRIGDILRRAASHGDIQTIQQLSMNERLRPFFNVNATDEGGSTSLIYASCFGQLQVVKYLLQLGAQVDIQDKIGWTALMWATTNNHHEIVQVLLDYSASSETKSSSGRTIYDLVDMDNDKIVTLLKPLTHQLERRRSARQRTSQEMRRDTFSPQEDELQAYEGSFRSVHKFTWDRCLPDQMFVFAEQDLTHVLDVAIEQFTLPLKSRAEIYVPVNIIFLSARFAHYFASRELLHQLLTQAVNRIKHATKSNSSDIHVLAFWIANLSQLLYYLKKDTGLVVATAEHQLEISELVSETYSFLIMDSEKRLDRILEPAMLEFQQIDGLETIDFADDWHRFFRRNRVSSSSSPSSPNRRSFGSVDNSSPPPVRPPLSPESIISLLTSILYVLQSYDVHPVIVIQAIAQLFHFMSCEIFNSILLNKKYLCRSRALQIRMNLTVVEEWIREHRLPNSLSGYFNPIVQLVQLLQCVSQLTDLMDFITTVKSFDLLNPMQVKRLVLNYRYEVSEQKLPEEIEKYTMQIAQDTRKSMQYESTEKKKSSGSRPSSITSLGSLLINSMSSQKKKPTRISNDDFDFEDLMEEKRDSQYMLPFSLPTTTNMVQSGWSSATNISEEQQDPDKMSLPDRIYYELKQRLVAEREKIAKEKSIVPSIPEEWLEKLDYRPSSSPL